mmetsp:Transcript_45275/g.75525  ORF Transcript_45275/g.75525 Transcript_45275/m.75525 type:complete len:398 (+) Transcript_45275:128-1321(+)|eukprot:CAMPEP_0198220528 /NCGR_PEP_ID=MMETSP1445-20131203/79456_1 /TAXON_ID=36898 /ORGANISM="Pyramimonas sp., Strain CCMP2087" /LENGTH=397 /DNA_ID=CAMNT_0043898337 /DNA_START=51 /DNA_END=1244 /DNA_ORIENTATION=+
MTTFHSAVLMALNNVGSVSARANAQMSRCPAKLTGTSSLDSRQRVNRCTRRVIDSAPAVFYPSSKRNQFALGGNKRVARTRETRVQSLHGSLSNSHSADYTFDEEDYHRVRLKYLVPCSGGSNEGSIMLTKIEDGAHPTDEKHTLLMTVNGDTFTALVNLVKGTGELRPSSLNLLGNILDEMKARQGMELAHVAVIDMQDDTFYGRLFFEGLKDGQLLQWDCDSRASDAVWLSMKTNVPIYVHRGVWDQVTLPIGDVVNKVSNDDPRAPVGSNERPESQNQVVESQSSREADSRTSASTTLPIPECIRRLKRELRVAISEEDYKTAARIRDHPFLHMYSHIEMAEKEGRTTHSKGLWAELLTLIDQQQDLNQRHELEWKKIFTSDTEISNLEQLGSS